MDAFTVELMTIILHQSDLTDHLQERVLKIEITLNKITETIAKLNEMN